MATAADLMGLGVPPQVARILGNTPVAVTCAGSSAGNARTLGIDTKIAYVNASNGGSGVAISTVGADTGPLLGDLMSITNDGTVGANITIYALNSAKFLKDGASVAGATGFALSIGQTVLLRPLTTSIIACVRSSV